MKLSTTDLLLIILAILLCLGEPDLLDAIIAWVGRLST